MAALTHFAPSRRFMAGLQANLAYWLRQTSHLTDTTINRLEPDFPNLLRVIEMGLITAETQIDTGRLMTSCFFWIEGAGHIHLWQPLLTKLLANLPSNQPLLRFQLLKQLGQFQHLQHQPELALATFQEALHLTHDPLLLADVYINQAKVYQTQGQYEQAEMLAQVVLPLVANRDTKLWAVTLETLGSLAQEQGQLIPAGAYLRQAIPLHTQTAITINIARATKTLATILLTQQNHNEALQLFQQTEELLQPTSYCKDQIELFINKGTLYYNLEQLDEAETAFQQASHLARHLAGLPTLKGAIANNLGCIWRDRQQWAVAESYYHQAIALYQQANNYLLTANVFGNLAKLHLRQEKLVAASDYFGKAIALLNQFPQNQWASELKQDYEKAQNGLPLPVGNPARA